MINEYVFIAKTEIRTSRLKLDSLTRGVKTPREHGKESPYVA